MSEAGAERRQWPRIPASLLGNVSASITAGPDVTLVNLSRGGALMEVAARYPMRSKVRLKLTRNTGEVTQVPGTVSWAKVASIVNGKINYLLAVIFDAAIQDLAVVTGVEDIERQARASTSPDTDYGDEAIHAVLDAVPPARSLSPVACDGPAFALNDEDLSGSLVADPGNVTPAVATGPDEAAVADSTRDPVDQAAVAAAESRADHLRRQLADQQALVQTLSLRLETLEVERAARREEHAAERERWQEERSALAHKAAEAVAVASELEAALQAREPEQQAALAEARAMHRVLESRIETLNAERSRWTTTLETERARWVGERSILERAAADAAARCTDLQAGIERRDQEQAQALDETRTAWQAERKAWEVDRIALAQRAADAAAHVRTLEESLQATQDEHVASVAGLQASILSLRTQLESLEAERLETRQAIAAARSSWDDERTRSVTELAARAEEFQAALQARDQVHVGALTEQQERFDGVIAELVQSANDQQAEYQELMAERKAVLAEQVLEAERAQSELARLRAEAEQDRAALAQRCRELELQLEAAEAVTVAQENRYRAVRQEAERLVALLSSPVQAEVPVEDINSFRAEGDAAQAVAGG